MKPERKRLSRAAGFRLPEDAVNVARNGRGCGAWGNLFRIGHKVMIRPGEGGAPYDGDLGVGKYGVRDATFEIRLVRDRNDAVALYIDRQERIWAEESSSVEAIVKTLRGRDLYCWCPLPEPGQPDICHGAVLLAVANGGRIWTPGVKQPDGSTRFTLKRGQFLV